MNKKILLLGGYGNFGKRIARALAKTDIPFIICGRSKTKAESFVATLRQTHPNCAVEIASFDINKNLDQQLKSLKPTVVINTCGPFQLSDYSVAKTCIQNQVHYIDLADGREFVNNIISLDATAKQQNVLVVSGASTVPGLISAVLENYKDEFACIDCLTFGIAPGQKTERGLATTKAILTYLGKPLKPFVGSEKAVYGWQDLYRQHFPGLGKRWMANCDIPDLDLLPKQYGLKHIRFSAGMESSALHLGMWLLSWGVRLGLPLNLPKHAAFLLRASHWFDWLGTDEGGMHAIMQGTDKQGKSKKIAWFIIAKNDDGPEIPTIPAIVLAKKIIHDDINLIGAMPCVALVTLDEYLAELADFAVTTQTVIPAKQE